MTGLDTLVTLGGHTMRKPGPWYWTDRKAWYVQINKKQIKLGSAKESNEPPPTIRREYHRVMALHGLPTETDQEQTPVIQDSEKLLAILSELSKSVKRIEHCLLSNQSKFHRKRFLPSFALAKVKKVKSKVKSSAKQMPVSVIPDTLPPGTQTQIVTPTVAEVIEDQIADSIPVSPQAASEPTMPKEELDAGFAQLPDPKPEPGLTSGMVMMTTPDLDPQPEPTPEEIDEADAMHAAHSVFTPPAPEPEPAPVAKPMPDFKAVAKSAKAAEIDKQEVRERRAKKEARGVLEFDTFPDDDENLLADVSEEMLAKMFAEMHRLANGG